MVYLADTNVLLRFADRSDPRHTIVREAVRKLKADGHTLKAAVQNFIEFWNVSTRPEDRNGFGLTAEEADRSLRLVERIFPRLPYEPEIYTEWRQLITRFKVLGVQSHDAHLVATMIGNDVTHILTFNTGDFKRYLTIGIVPVDPVDVDSGS